MLANGFGWAPVLPAATALLAASAIAGIAWREYSAGDRANSDATHARQTATDVSLFDMMPGLVTCHDASGNLLAIRGVDKAAYLSVQPQFDAMSYFDAVHISGRIQYLQAIDDLRQGAATAQAQFLLYCGEERGFRPVRAMLTAQIDMSRVFSGFVMQTIDVSAESTLKADADAWQAEARTANDAKTRFLAAVSHELRTPLNAILGFSDILIGEYFGKFENDRQREYVDLINQSGHHLLAVVNAMLDMSKIEAGRYELIKEPFNIHAAVHAVDEMLALQAKTKGVILTSRVPKGLDDVVADRRAIQQVLINLAGNAIKFTKPGGVVAIDATVNHRNLVISVSDTGIGIPADKIAMIGKPFHQVQNDYTRQYEGTGLGLALVKGLVSLHGGTFLIESEEGHGTVITVTVPVDGETENGGETVEFPPRLKDIGPAMNTGEHEHGNVKAKSA